MHSVAKFRKLLYHFILSLFMAECWMLKCVCVCV